MDIIHIAINNAPYKGNIAAKTYEEWKQLLIKHKVSYFFAYAPWWKAETVSPDYEWAKNHPEDFEKLKSWNTGTKHPITVYRINK